MKKFNKKYLYIIIGLFLELLSFMLLGGSEAKLTFIACLVSIPVGLIMIWYMEKSYENTILVTNFIIFSLPLGGYVFLRLGILDKQWIFYLVFYIGAFLLLVKNGLFSRINKETNIMKNKYLRLVLLILLLLNILFAFDKQLSFMILSLSFIPFILLFFVIRSSHFNNRKDFYNKILHSIVLGTLISVMPDFLFYIFSLVIRTKIRIYGPLGSNAILAYSLIIFVITLSKWVKEKGIKNIWTLYIIGFILTLGIQESRGSLIVIFAIFMLYMIFNIGNWKKYTIVFLMIGFMGTFNVIARPDVSNPNVVNEMQDILNSKVDNDTGENKSKIQQLIIKVIEPQSKTRQIIWKTSLEITNDYKLTGVGIGNYKYFYKEYSGTERGYIDSHNILLNLSSELGIPFMIISLILMIKIGIDAMLGYFKNKGNRRITYLSLGVALVTFFLYGNLTGIALNFTGEVYSFSSTFIIIFILFYEDYIEEF